jgi:hypothetical protein
MYTTKQQSLSPAPLRYSSSLRLKATQTPRHSNNFHVHRKKGPANSTVPLCSALFRQKISARDRQAPAATTSNQP